MTDLRATIAPKSDQLNSDDLIGRTLTITVTKVSLCSEPDQPIAVNYDGDNGKPYKPCKSMRRVLVNVWGPDGNGYVGRSMTLYRDDKVQFGGMAVGGIRISHMSHIKKDVTMALTATRANRKPFTVKPLAETEAPVAPNLQELFGDAERAAKQGVAAYQGFWKSLNKGQQQHLLVKHAELKATAQAADDSAVAEQASGHVAESESIPFGDPDDDFPGDRVRDAA